MPDDGRRYELIDGDLIVTPVFVTPIAVTACEHRGGKYVAHLVGEDELRVAAPYVVSFTAAQGSTDPPPGPAC